MSITRSVGVSMRTTSKALQSLRTSSGNVPSESEDLNSLYPKFLLNADVKKFISHREYDKLIKDVDEKNLIDIGSKYKVEHLSIGAFSEQPFPVQGRIHDDDSWMVPLVCRYPGNTNAVNCWFRVASGSPCTYLTAKSMEAIVGKRIDRNFQSICIQDEKTNIECYLSKDHFQNDNLLGTIALAALEVNININWEKGVFTMYRS